MEEKKDSEVIKEYFIDITKDDPLKAGKDDVFQDTKKNDSLDAEKDDTIQDIAEGDSLDAEKDEDTQDTAESELIDADESEFFREFDIRKEKAAVPWYKNKSVFNINTLIIVLIFSAMVFCVFQSDTTQKKSDTGLDTSKVSRNIYFTLGSTQEEVRRLMGPPTDTYKDTWRYNTSEVYFNENGMVGGWYIRDRDLKVSLGDKVPNAPAVKKGSTKQTVINYWGTPKGIVTDTLWMYEGFEIKYDRDGRVDSAYDYGNKKYLIR